MATGTPSKKGRGADNELWLSYEGKKPATEILANRALPLRSAWSLNSEPSNSLIWGENLGSLLSLASNPKVRGKVRLVYIDPPFSTQSVFHTRDNNHAYEDTLRAGNFVEFLRERIIVLRELLADNGSLYLHLDDKMVFALKLVLDEVFGPGSFRNCITRKKCNPKNFTRRAYGNVVDHILFYTKGDDYIWNRQYEPWTEERAREYQYVDEASGRRYMKVPVHAPGTRNGETGQPWRGRLPPPGKHWQYPPRVLDELDQRGEIFWSSNGNPRKKVFLDLSEGVAVQDLWLDYKDAHNQNIRVTGYPTEKNLALLTRIISASSDPGDIVLDAFSGSGTTLVAAAALGRRWIGIDQGPSAIETTLRRFAVGSQVMGDFVGSRLRNSKPVLEAQAITDFALLVAPENEELAGSTLAAWHEMRASAPSTVGVDAPPPVRPDPPREDGSRSRRQRNRRESGKQGALPGIADDDKSPSERTVRDEEAGTAMMQDSGKRAT